MVGWSRGGAVELGVRGFESVATRMVLANTGLTTPLLVAAARGGVEPRVGSVELLAAGGLSAEAREVLGVAAGQRCWVRRSRLLTEFGTPLSDNVVTCLAGVSAAIDEAVLDEGRPIGPALAATGLVLVRRVVAVGHGVWPGGAGAAGRCAVKSYALEMAGRVVVHIEERYSPAFFPSAVD